MDDQEMGMQSEAPQEGDNAGDAVVQPVQPVEPAEAPAEESSEPAEAPVEAPAEDGAPDSNLQTEQPDQPVPSEPSEQ